MEDPKCKGKECEFFEGNLVYWCVRGDYVPNGICWTTIREQRNFLYKAFEALCNQKIVIKLGNQPLLQNILSDIHG